MPALVPPMVATASNALQQIRRTNCAWFAGFARFNVPLQFIFCRLAAQGVPRHDRPGDACSSSGASFSASPARLIACLL